MSFVAGAGPECGWPLMRDLISIEQRTQALRSSPQVSDEALLRALAGEDESQEDPSSADQVGPLALLLSENYLAAVASALYALEIGSPEPLAAAVDDIQLGEQA